MFIPWNTRFTKQYRRRLRQKLGSLDRNFSHGVVVTLTTHATFYTTPYYSAKHVWKAFDNFMHVLRREYPKIKYIASMEFTQKNYPHIHVFFPGMNYLLNKKALKKMWGACGLGRIVDVRKARDMNGLHYTMKYLTKLEHNETHKALVWFAGVRLYNTSRGLLESLPKLFGGGFTKLDHIIEYGLLDGLAGEEVSVLDDGYSVFVPKYFDLDGVGG